MEAPFIARALYAFYDLTKERQYRDAADRFLYAYVYTICARIPVKIMAFECGMALEAASLLAKSDPRRAGEMTVYVRLLVMWLRSLSHDDFGPHFWCGYPPVSKGQEDKPDVGYSDDLCHVGRGLIRAYEFTRDESLLADVEKLTRYFLTDLKDDTMDGVWMPAVGTWAIGPWPEVGFEHLPDTPANRAGWVYSAYGDAEFLLDACAYRKDADARAAIAERCARSVEWIFDTCAFEDGAIGMAGRDDKWLGLTAAGVLGALKAWETGALAGARLAKIKPRVEKAWKFLLSHTGDAFPHGGYIRETGRTNLIPGDNVGWLYAWTVLCLAQETEMRQFLPEA